MGYDTRFVGELRFKKPLTPEQKAKLETFFQEDIRDHPEWKDDQGLTDINLDWAWGEEGEAIEWDGGEKSYQMDKKIDLITRVMRETWPDFSFTGGFACDGDDFGDLWEIEIGEDGWVRTYDQQIVRVGRTCPHCGGMTYEISMAQ